MDTILRLIPVGAIVFYGNTTDHILLVGYKIWKDWDFFRSHLEQWLAQIDSRLVIALATILITSLVLLQVGRMYLGFQQSSTGLDSFTAKPMIFPCRTAHTRFFPRKHNFSYSFLMVGVPVGWKGVTGGMLSVDLPRLNRSWTRRLFSFKPWSSWYTVDADDHLGRGHAEGGLEEKLHDYLRSQDEKPENYPFAYLMTPPRLFGYYSNPVSIWNLYSPKKELAAMILEVNNTFNERHNYFLKVDTNATRKSQTDEPPRFVQHWPKDFHVSVFNSREGSYSISASDPIYPALSGPGALNTTITLSSSKKHPKLVARVFSTYPALDPKIMTVSEKIMFLCKWWWVSFLTFPRTVQQALTLMWTKQMRFVTRPEPRGNTMCRDADARELFLEHGFKRYLTGVVEKCETPVIVKYTAGGLLDTEGEMIYSPSALLASREECEYIEIKVLTPLFYSRFASYPKALDGLLSEHHESETVSISNPLFLDSLDFTIFTPPAPLPESIFHNLDHLSLAVLRRLRLRPKPIENEETLKSKIKKTKPPYISAHHDNFSTQSDLDHFILFHGSPGDRLVYTMSLTKLFLANILGFGFMELLDLEIWVVRCGLVCFVAAYYLHL